MVMEWEFGSGGVWVAVGCGVGGVGWLRGGGGLVMGWAVEGGRGGLLIKGVWRGLVMGWGGAGLRGVWGVGVWFWGGGGLLVMGWTVEGGREGYGVGGGAGLRGVCGGGGCWFWGGGLVLGGGVEGRWLWGGTDPPSAAALTVRRTEARLQPSAAGLSVQVGGEVEAAARGAVFR